MYISSWKIDLKDQNKKAEEDEFAEWAIQSIL